MNRINLAIEDGKLLRDLDSEFDIVWQNPDNQNLDRDKNVVTIMDSRKDAEIRAVIRKVYKRNMFIKEY